MNPEPPGKSQGFAGSLARTKLLVALVVAVGGGAVAMVAGARLDAPLVGWDVLALVFGIWVWLTVWRLSPADTASHARREDPTRDVADVVLLGAAEGEVEIKLPGRFAVSPSIAGALKAIAGVVAVEHV